MLCRCNENTSYSGTKTRICNLIANEIWTWSIDRNIWLSAEHLPGSKNVLAAEQSRVFDDTAERMINKCVFLELVKVFGSPAIDLFASRLNKQVTTFVSWKPDQRIVTSNYSLTGPRCAVY